MNKTPPRTWLFRPFDFQCEFRGSQDEALRILRESVLKDGDDQQSYDRLVGIVTKEIIRIRRNMPYRDDQSASFFVGTFRQCGDQTVLTGQIWAPARLRVLLRSLLIIAGFMMLIIAVNSNRMDSLQILGSSSMLLLIWCLMAMTVRSRARRAFEDAVHICDQLTHISQIQ